MKSFSTVLALSVAVGIGAGVAGFAAPAAAQTAALQLTTGKVVTDPAGAFISVSVKNGTTAPISETYVACEFFAGNRALGKSSTTLFSIVPGVTGSDQVRLLGGTSANRATCAITGHK
ncbi:hypothetical protein V5F34_12860 [Xanthobacter autotrophicus]|jgi:hypothetical protein|uniref:Uncharacterized protein n=1 Tax=Xanthobacter autotrophicus TaxID=280 RepID=A0A6C1KDZ3_XANAU|nr:hypothetical protein [Xanthobacter autotrophicus]TLX41757.1 hypothetical protein FBQ73_16695 [Xanthobacter autotrophicus]